MAKLIGENRRTITMELQEKPCNEPQRKKQFASLKGRRSTVQDRYCQGHNSLLTF